MNFLAVHWLWMYAGALLALAELGAPGLVAIFFGLAAGTTGAAVLLFPALPLWGQLVVFSVFSVAYLLTLRPLFVGNHVKTADVSEIEDGYTGKTARVTVAIEPRQAGRVMLGDAEWDAVADAPIAADALVRIVGRTNLTLKVTPL